MAGVAAFRILFGLLMFAGIVRFLASGWVAGYYREPEFLFRFWGFGWLPVLPGTALVAVYVALAGLALAIALGLFYRASAALFFAGFTYTQLLDVTNYLNHYYLIALLSLLLVALPLDRAWSVDAWRRPSLRGDTVPAWVYWLLRFQIGVVYVYAGLAKATSDWLLHAQPLNLWLTARTDTPLIGPWLDELWVAYAASWGGFLFDTTIVLWLLHRRTRPFAYVTLLVFHGLTHLWFNIGMFPFVMSLAATVFFSPSWPRRWLPRRTSSPAPAVVTTALPRRAALALALAFCAVQALFPLRHLLYPGDVLWNEEGMRFSWKVMAREKHGSVTFHVRQKESGREVQISPRRYLNARQEREMGSQPDLILQLAHHIARDFERQGYGPVEVRAEALVSLNGRAPQLLIDPSRDLTTVRDGLGAKDWILPGPEAPPKQLRAAVW